MTAGRSMAARHPAPPDEVEPPTYTYIPVPRAVPEWDGQWTSRPPSTLVGEVAAAQQAHEEWVAGFPDESLPADADEYVQPWTTPETA